MLEWMHPAWFLALPAALLPWAAWLRPYALRFGSLAAVRTSGGVRGFASVLSPVLESIAIVLVVAALARPQQVERETVTESDGIDIMLAIDTSGSMGAPDMGVRGTDLKRIDAAKIVMRRFVEGRPNDRLGLLVFGQEAFIQVPLTLDHESLGQFIADLELGVAGKAATAVGSGIAVAAKHMKELKAPSKVVILVTDGRSNAGSLSPRQAAEAAAALGIRVYTIGVGSTGGGSVLSQMLGRGGADVDEPTLQSIAALTGGRYYRATDAAALAAVYKEIDQLEKSTAQVKEYVHRDELYLGLLVPALLLYGLERLLTAGPLRRLP